MRCEVMARERQRNCGILRLYLPEQQTASRTHSQLATGNSALNDSLSSAIANCNLERERARERRHPARLRRGREQSNSMRNEIAVGNWRRKRIALPKESSVVRSCHSFSGCCLCTRRYTGVRGDTLRLAFMTFELTLFARY